MHLLVKYLKRATPLVHYKTCRTTVQPLKSQLNVKQHGKVHISQWTGTARTYTALPLMLSSLHRQ